MPRKKELPVPDSGEQDDLLSTEPQESPDAPLTEPQEEPIPTESPPDEGAPEDDSAEERQIVRLANQALLSSAELIKCAERGVRTLHSDAQLMDCLYDDELTTSENLPTLMAASRQARPVSAAIANLYLHKQIVFERC